MRGNTQGKIYGHVHLKTVTKPPHANVPETPMCVHIHQKIGPVQQFWRMVLHVRKNVSPRII